MDYLSCNAKTHIILKNPIIFSLFYYVYTNLYNSFLSNFLISPDYYSLNDLTYVLRTFEK